MNKMLQTKNINGYYMTNQYNTLGQKLNIKSTS